MYVADDKARNAKFGYFPRKLNDIEQKKEVVNNRKSPLTCMEKPIMKKDMVHQENKIEI